MARKIRQYGWSTWIDQDDMKGNIDAAMAKDEVWLTTEDVMKHLNMSRSSVYRLRVSNKLPAYRLGRTIMYPKSFINTFLLSNAVNNLNGSSTTK